MKIPLGKPVFDKEMENAAVYALQNERFVLGESVFKFEEEFAKYCGTDFAVSTNSGTEALRLSLIAAGVHPGQEAITSPASFIASANAIFQAQCKPVFADIEADTCTLNATELANAVTVKTKAVLPVHLYGYPADIDAMNEVAKKHNLLVIEDACQAHGASIRGKKAGNLADIGCFSFYPSKNMTVAGDGGMITTNDSRIAVAAAKLRDCGRKSQYIHDVIGYTARLNTVNAAIGRAQLRRIDAWNEKRREIARTYSKLLADISGLTLPSLGSAAVQPVHHLYVIRTAHRDQLKAWLEGHGIGVGVHYALPIHLQPIYRELFGYTAGAYPKAEALCQTCLSLPIYPDLTEEETKFISQKIHEFFEKALGEGL